MSLPRRIEADDYVRKLEAENAALREEARGLLQRVSDVVAWYEGEAAPCPPMRALMDSAQRARVALAPKEP